MDGSLAQPTNRVHWNQAPGGQHLADLERPPLPRADPLATRGTGAPGWSADRLLAEVGDGQGATKRT